MTLRIVLDTNLIVSAVLLPSSLSRHAFDAAVEMGVVIVTEATVTEVTEVLHRPRFDRYLLLEERLQFLSHFISNVLVVVVTETITDCRDAKDNKFLEAAIAGSASHLITGDDDLLVLDPYRDVTILNARTFLTQVIGRNLPSR
jgi:uncharacterized protein